MWGYVVRAVLDELRDEDVHVIGLTATPPSDLTGPEDELYAELLGPVDFTVPTPAVVREGHLAPYQELAWLTEPLDSERAWLAEHDTRFKELITALHDDAEGPHSFPALGDHAHARAPPLGGRRDQMPWEDFQHAPARRSRAPACASSARPGWRCRRARRAARPTGAPPDLDDWLVLLEDYALRCLHASPAPEAADRYAAVVGRARPSSASSSRAAGSAAARRRSTGC